MFWQLTWRGHKPTTPLRERETVMRSSTGLTDRSASYLSVWRATEHESRLGALDEVCVKFAHLVRSLHVPRQDYKTCAQRGAVSSALKQHRPLQTHSPRVSILPEGIVCRLARLDEGADNSACPRPNCTRRHVMVRARR